MDAEEFDRVFDEGKEDVLQYMDLSSARRPNRDTKRVNVDLVLWMVEALDNEAKRLGVTRQSVIKMWLSEKIEENWRRLATEERVGKDKQTG
jgi:hypothetical protein